MTTILPRNEYWKTLNKKVIGSGAFIRNEVDEILILNTTYRDGWLWAGGTCEQDESPKAACEREITEELGLDVRIGRLLCIDYKHPKDLELHDETIQMVFDGGVLTSEQIKQITLNPEEHTEYKFASVDEAQQLLHPALAKRIPFILNALKTQSSFYLEDGEPVNQ